MVVFRLIKCQIRLVFTKSSHLILHTADVLLVTNKRVLDSLLTDPNQQRTQQRRNFNNEARSAPVQLHKYSSLRSESLMRKIRNRKFCALTRWTTYILHAILIIKSYQD